MEYESKGNTHNNNVGFVEHTQGAQASTLMAKAQALYSDLSSCKLSEWIPVGPATTRGEKRVFLVQSRKDGVVAELIVYERRGRSQIRAEVMALAAVTGAQLAAPDEVDFAPFIQCFGEQRDFSVMTKDNEGPSFVQADVIIVRYKSQGDSLQAYLDSANPEILVGHFSMMMESLFRAVSRVHQLDLVYLNVKPHTLRVTADSRIILSDFSNARYLNGQRKVPAISSAPECRYGRSKTGYVAKSDVFELGALLHNIYSEYIEHTPFKFLPKYGLQDLVTNMMFPNPGQRPTLNNALNHAFFKTWGSVILQDQTRTLSSPRCNFEDYEILFDPKRDVAQGDDERAVGEGTDAFTRRVRRLSDGKVFILKMEHQVDDDDKEGESIREEVFIMDHLRDQTFVPRIECYHLEGPVRLRNGTGTVRFRNDLPGYIMEFVEGVTLEDFWAQHFDSNAGRDAANNLFRSMALSMTAILKQLHATGVVHLDLHANNWMVPSNQPLSDSFFPLRLIDFSRARNLAGPRFDSAGAAPEVDASTPIRRCFGSRCGYSEASDVFALGEAFQDIYMVIKDRMNMVNTLRIFENLWKSMMRSESAKRISLDDVLESPALLLTD
jgi:serine/threonine protein kinase